MNEQNERTDFLHWQATTLAFAHRAASIPLRLEDLWTMVRDLNEGVGDNDFAIDEVVRKTIKKAASLLEASLHSPCN